MKLEIETPDSLAIVSRKVVATLDITKLNPTIMAQAAMHGLKQKIADAAASAASLAAAEDETRTVEEVALDLMEKAIRRLCESGWTASREAADPLARWARKIVLAVIKQNPTYVEKFDTYKLIKTAADKAAYLDKIWEGNEKIIAKAKELQAADAKRKAEESNMLGGVDI